MAKGHATVRPAARRSVVNLARARGAPGDRGLSGPNRARQAASATGAARGATYAEGAADAEVVILTVPWAAIDDTLRQLGELNNTVVVDVSYPTRKSEREALEGSSTAEQCSIPVPPLYGRMGRSLSLGAGVVSSSVLLHG